MYRLEVDPLDLDFTEVVTDFIPFGFAPLSIMPIPFSYLRETPFRAITTNEIERLRVGRDRIIVNTGSYNTG